MDFKKRDMRNNFKFLFLSFSVLIFSFLGLAQAADINMSVDVGGVVPPANVSNFTATSGDGHISLSWSNPGDADFAGVKIQRSTTYYPADENAGDNVYNGTGTVFVDQNLNNGTRYYYSAFSYDTSLNYASGALASAIPTAPPLPQDGGLEELIMPPSVTSVEPTAPTIAKEEIELSDFKFYILYDQGPLEITLDELKKIRVFEEMTLIISISADIFPKEVSVITVTIGNFSYLMRKLVDQNEYQAIISAPPIKGEYDIKFIIVYQDSTIADIQGKMLVDPYGYIYEKRFSLFGIGGGETRIERARVTLYCLNEDDWQKWKAEDYNQENPVATDNTGEFGFMVPEGEYYLQVTKSGYLTKKISSFEVKEQIINKNIELTSLIRPWIWVIVLGAGIILVIVWILIRRKRA